MTEYRIELRRMVVALQKYSYRYANEAQLHRAIAGVLESEGFTFEHEKTIGEDRYDFWCEPGIVIEVKMARSATEAHRQVDRYCAQPHVKAVILVTTKAWKAKGDVAEVRGKPVTFIRIRGQAF